MNLNDYQLKALETADDKGFELTHRTLGLSSEAGEVAGKLSKWLRDGKGDEAKLDKAALAAEIGDVLWFSACLADTIGYKLDDIATQNLAKLSSRKSRGVIAGSGDNR